MHARTNTHTEPLFDLASYVNNPSLSDVTLISEDRLKFHAHRLVLCAQSPVFKAMLDSELWVESSNKEVMATYGLKKLFEMSFKLGFI